MKNTLHLHLGVMCATALLLALPRVVLAQAAGAGRPRASDVTDERLRHADQDAGNWLTHGGDWDELRYSRLTGINADNVGALKPTWSAEFDT